VARSNHNHDAAYVNVAEPTSITSAMIVDGTIVNADISSLAAIDISKLSGVASSTHNHDAAYVNEGQASSITSAMIVDGAVAPVDVSFNYAGGVSKGGPATDLNCTGCVGSSDLLDGAVTKGKLSATGGGTSGQVLGTDGANLTWQSASAGVGWVDDGTAVRLATATDRVGIGIAIPDDELHVKGPNYLQGIFESTNSSGGIQLVAYNADPTKKQRYELQSLTDGGSYCMTGHIIMDLVGT